MSELPASFWEMLIHWAERDLEQRLVVARPEMSQAEMPPGVELSRKEIVGKRVLVRTRDNGPQKVVKARWPEAGLHETYSPKLICVLKGMADYRAGEYIITCGEGHFIVLPPLIPNTTGNQSHLEGERKRTGSCGLLQLILMRDHIIGTLCLSRGEMHREDKMHLISHALTVDLFRLFLEEARQGERTELLRHLLTTSFALMRRDVKENPGQVRVPLSLKMDARSTTAEDTLQQIYAYIRANLDQSPTIGKVAQAMHMSPSQFTRYVRRKTGKSFVQVLTEFRLEEAKRLLSQTEWSIEAVAKQVGLRSLPYFFKFFAENTGCSPGRYREEEDRIKDMIAG
jgi:AraC-like DNA-binding protein